MSGRNNFNSHPSLGKDILFQEKSKLVPFNFFSHSKLYNDKNVL